jgi:DNA-binding beta-propeller fold protein YncE
LSAERPSPYQDRFPQISGGIRVSVANGLATGAGDAYAMALADENNAVTPISTATNTAGRPIRTGDSPTAIAITP